jgi:hypothetical protein
MIFAWSRRMGVVQSVVLLVGMAAAVVGAGSATGADRKHNAAPPAVPATSAPAGYELVGKLLENGPSDPDVPLPQANLSTRRPGPAAAAGPSLYGRQEDQGAVLGLKIPIPATRAAH